MKKLVATFIALSSIGPAMAEPGFEEFDHSTVDFNVEHIVPAGAILCQESEFPDLQTFEQRRCRHLEKAIRVKVEVVYHGITAPQFYVRAVKGTVKGWTVRNNIH